MSPLTERSYNPHQSPRVLVNYYRPPLRCQVPVEYLFVPLRTVVETYSSRGPVPYTDVTLYGTLTEE